MDTETARPRSSTRRAVMEGRHPSYAYGTDSGREKSLDWSKSTTAKSTQAPSAQALSFWSMYSSAGTPMSTAHNIMVTDLACAVVTILAIALLILSLSMLINKPEGETSREVVVRGHFGSVQGVRHTVLGHTDVYTFLGVPYAHPPLGDLRFRRSFLDSDTSLSLGVEIDATSARPACVQSSSDASLTIVSEDCLHLNIWTPTKECTHASCADKPVLVFLHGGSFQTGGNAHPLYDGRYLSAFGDAVIVVPNYRLGAMGFLNAGSANAPGNVGLDDQLVALQWTRKNIGSFGGNASNMVLVGYGAGAAAAGYLLFASAAGTVDSEVVPRRAILMSGSPFTRYPDNTGAIRQRRVDEQAKRLRCASGSVPSLQCLRATNASYFSKTAMPPLFFPSFHEIMPFRPRELIGNTKMRITGVDVLLGHTEDESMHAMQIAQSISARSDDFLKTTSDLLHALGLNNHTAKAIVEKYLVGQSNSTDAFSQFVADLFMVCPVSDFGHYLASTRGNRVFRYLVSENVTEDAGDMLRLVLGAPYRRPLENDAMRIASHRIIVLWLHFTKTGNLPNLPPLGYSRYDVTVTGFDEENLDDPHNRFEFCNFLRSLKIL